MTIDPYHHEHVDVEEIPWSRLGRILIELAEKIRKDWQPDVVVGIAKGGVIPAVFLSSAFLLDFFPIKLSSRKNEKIVRDIPDWYVYPSEQVADKNVLLVDDICVAGRTFDMAKKELEKLKAKEIRTASIAIHGESVKPDYYILDTDGLIIWPWDRDTLSKEGTWTINEEYFEEMKEIAGYNPGPSPAKEPVGQWIK
jgi:hypoxanthine phosphoribosyltransferase